MKKALAIVSLIIGSVMIVSAQNLNIGGTIGGTPVSYSTANGGTLNVGVVANTAQQSNGNAVLKLLALAQTIVSRLVPFAVGLAVLAFFWFLIVFIWKGRDNPKSHEDGMKGMGYSILALFVMVSIWGIIGFAGSMLGIGQGGSIPAIQMPGVK